MRRMFVSTHEAGAAERWYEVGHLVAGLSFWLRKVRQTNGQLRQIAEGLGFKIEGSAEPAQNDIEAYRFYTKIFNGVRGLAFLCSDDDDSGKLWLFRQKTVGGIGTDDCRVAIVTELGYESPRQSAATEFSGWIPSFEMYRVSSLTLNGIRLSYKVEESLEVDALPTQKIGN